MKHRYPTKPYALTRRLYTEREVLKMYRAQNNASCVCRRNNLGRKYRKWKHWHAQANKWEDRAFDTFKPGLRPCVICADSTSNQCGRCDECLCIY